MLPPLENFLLTPLVARQQVNTTPPLPKTRSQIAIYNQERNQAFAKGRGGLKMEKYCDVILMTSLLVVSPK